MHVISRLIICSCLVVSSYRQLIIFSQLSSLLSFRGIDLLWASLHTMSVIGFHILTSSTMISYRTTRAARLSTSNSSVALGAYCGAGQQIAGQCDWPLSELTSWMHDVL